MESYPKRLRALICDKSAEQEQNFGQKKCKSSVAREADPLIPQPIQIEPDSEHDSFFTR